VSDYLPEEDPAIECPQAAPPDAVDPRPAREMPCSADPSPSLRVALLGASLGALLAILYTIVMLAAHGFPEQPDGPALLIIALGTQPALLAGVLLALAAGKVSIRQGLAWHPVPWTALVLAPIGLLGASVVGDWCGTALWNASGKGHGALQMIAESLRAFDGVWRPLAVLGLALLPGLCEEVLFRGLLQGSLRRYGRVVALLVPAAAFSAFHGDLVQGMGAFVLGLYLGELRHRSGSIVPGVVAHAANNLVAGTAMVLASDAELEIMQSAPPGVVAAAAAVALLCLAGVRQVRR